ncbi:hypothetical protein MUK42_31487 [Musa troglodytarum]|uniref:Uncharacterized protein n=1 Tax=Musa troglodytarum TaxID=320322 RepID=A0A9E7L1R7_9LILI|nr:hypothetical protein MUK42_31487 [Musa troglodytarum]
MTLGFIYEPANYSDSSVLWTPDAAGFSCGKQKGSRTTELQYERQSITLNKKPLSKK